MKSKHSLINLGLIGLVFLLVCFIIGKLFSAASPDTFSKETVFSDSEKNIIELAQKQVVSSSQRTSSGHNQSVVIKDAVVCLNIQDQKPVGIVSQITSNIDRIYCWAKVINGKGQKIRYIWYINGKAYFSQWQVIISQRFRTWCSYAIDFKAKEKCYVEIVNQTGRILVHVDFKIVSPSSRGRIKHL